MAIDETNDQLVLLAGKPATGKSASLRGIRNQERWLYLNTEAGKRLPFRNSFNAHRIDDPYQVFDIIDAAMDPDNADQIDGIIIDSITFLMEMFESRYIYQSSDSRSAWGDYAQYWKKLMQEKVVAFGKPVIMIAHLQEERDAATGKIDSSVPVKGSLGKNGLEAYFSTIVTCKKVNITELEKVTNGMLEVTDREKAVGYKHIFQTLPTRNTTGEPIRSPMDMFTDAETYIDNDAQKLLDHLTEFYGS